ncbi:hypothetical protein HPA01_11530, partial [Streptococcus suis]|nr:hypothetical protein [Streptococcus suis]
LFIIGHMGLFVYTQKGSIISLAGLPTTEIIEPIEKVPKSCRLWNLFLFTCSLNFFLPWQIGL